MTAIPARLWDKVEKTETCWNWTGNLSRDGYGRMFGHKDFGTTLPHRITWQSANGPVPDGLELDHICNNRRCVRPGHMEAVTHAENVRRAWARKTECPNGHPYTPENRVPDSRGGERCLPCRRIAGAKSLRDARRRAWPVDQPFPYDVKQWARSQGIPVNGQGPVSRAVREAYIAAHPTYQRTDKQAA